MIKEKKDNTLMPMECGLEAITAAHVIHDRNFNYELGTFWHAKTPVVDPPGFNLFHYHLTSTPYIWYFHKYYIKGNIITEDV